MELQSGKVAKFEGISSYLVLYSEGDVEVIILRRMGISVSVRILVGLPFWCFV